MVVPSLVHRTDFGERLQHYRLGRLSTPSGLVSRGWSADCGCCVGARRTEGHPSVVCLANLLPNPKGVEQCVDERGVGAVIKCVTGAD